MGDRVTQRGRDKCDWTGWVGQGETKQELVVMETHPSTMRRGVMNHLCSLLISRFN